MGRNKLETVKFAAVSGGIAGIGIGMILASIAVAFEANPVTNEQPGMVMIMDSIPVEAVWVALGAGVLVFGVSGLADVYRSEVTYGDAGESDHVDW